MRLADFILANLEPILSEWEIFARSVWPGGKVDTLALRDHASDILRATAWDMKSAQTATQQSDKSRGEGADGKDSARVDGASDVHAVARVHSGFDLLALVSEYRALRASVIRLWRESEPSPDDRDLADLTRYNEAIDQSLTEAIRSYTERVDRSRQMFLAILGHDLRGPLNSMTMSAQVLELSDGLGTELVGMASQISASAHAMARMISDLLDFTGTGLGAAMPVSPAPMDLKTLCEDVLRETRAGHQGRTFRFEAAGDLAGEWDAARLRQMISNLLGNAAQHGPASGEIEFTASADAAGVRLSFHNGGAPIPPEALPTLFDPLVRAVPAENPRARRPGSIGLGLYIAREIARAHGGTLEVESSGGAGTRFTARLPRHAAPRH